MYKGAMMCAHVEWCAFIYKVGVQAAEMDTNDYGPIKSHVWQTADQVLNSIFAFELLIKMSSYDFQVTTATTAAAVPAIVLRRGLSFACVRSRGTFSTTGGTGWIS